VSRNPIKATEQKAGNCHEDHPQAHSWELLTASDTFNVSQQPMHKSYMPPITTPFSGGCACGAIRYESTTEPAMMLNCHCRDCQRSSGGAFSSLVIVPTDAFKLLQGSPRFHASPSEAGGQTHRGFCPECGSPIIGKPDAVPHIVAIRTASLDDPSWFNPQVDVWTSDAHPWDQMNPALPKFEKYPSAGDSADPVAP
jgi:hypothetical protein